VKIDEFEYNRSDLLALLDDENFEQKYAYHRKIWQSKSLLLLLEKEEISLGNEIRQELDLIKKDPVFFDFFSSYFKSILNNLFKSVLSPIDASSLSLLAQLETYVLPEHKIEAFQSISNFLIAQERIIRNTTVENYILNKDELDFWIANEWPDFINHLPAHLQDEKEDLILSLINLTFALQFRFRKETKLISYKLTAVNFIDENYRDTIVNNDNIFSGKVKKAERSYWWLIWVGIWIMKWLFSDSCK
jgi:hypothetical protein